MQSIRNNVGTTSTALVPYFPTASNDSQQNHPNFIESNSSAISVGDLSTKCIVPTFADNKLTIAHQNFIQSVVKAGELVFGDLTPVECRVSHQINGRIPSALHKKESELKENEKTIYYQRMAFCCHAKNIVRTINGQIVHLCLGGVRSYAEDRLYSSISPMKFKIFVGWQVKVCSNLMLSNDGFTGNLNCLTEFDLIQNSIELFKSFDPKKDQELRLLEELRFTQIPEEVFCQIIGRLRLYQFLRPSDQKRLPSINIGDQAVNNMVRGYISNPNFGKRRNADITLWNLLQLGNEAVKQSYIDRWLDRNVEVTNFAMGLQKAIEGNDNEGYGWFLN